MTKNNKAYNGLSVFIAPLCMAAVFMFSVAARAEVQTDKGPLISVELRNVDIKDVLRALSQEHGINIIVDDNISGTVTVSIKNVPLWDAIDSILRSKGYSYRIIKSGLLLVEPLSDFARKQEDVVIKEFKLKYLTVSGSSMEPLKSFMSDKGQVITVSSTNSVIVKDIPVVVAKVSSLIETMDVEPKQVMIEAKIVEVSTKKSAELGISWTAAVRGGNTTTDFSVNVPTAATPAGAVGFGYVANRFQLNARLSALEGSGSAKIVSSPKIRVLENQEASITSGTQILVAIANITTPGSQPPTFDARLELKVTPRTVGDEQVALSISTTRDEFDNANKVNGFPPKETREAETKVIVKDGETVVIGGIFKKNITKQEQGVPFLSRIPLLGWLFKSRSSSDDQVELLIFITPTVLKEKLVSEEAKL